MHVNIMGSGHISTHFYATTPHNNHDHTNTIDSWRDCPISSDRGRSILRLIPGHTRSQSKVRCILHVGACLLSHRTFFRKEIVALESSLAPSKSPNLFTAPAEDSSKKQAPHLIRSFGWISGPGDWSKTLTFQLCMYQSP